MPDCVFNPKDKEIEKKVIKGVSKLYKKFEGYTFEQDPDMYALFDFKGRDHFGIHRLSVEIKALYNEPDKYPNNIISIDKWQHFIQNQNRIFHYVVYIYPKHKFLRVYDLGQCNTAFIGHANIHHKRKDEDRTDEVAFLPTISADFSISYNKDNGKDKK